MKKKLKPECAVYMIPSSSEHALSAGTIYIHDVGSGRLDLIKNNGESYESAFDIESLKRVLKPLKIGEL